MPIVDLRIDKADAAHVQPLILAVTDAVQHALAMRRQGVTMVVRLLDFADDNSSLATAGAYGKESTMPIVRIDLSSGREPAMKRELMNAVTAAVQNALGVEAREVRVLLNEVDPDHWAIGGETLAERDAARASEAARS